MTLQVGIWAVSDGGPTKATRSRLSLEFDLEEWIAADTALLADGLKLVGRQIHLDAGFLDLLCIDVRGAWVVVELKRDQLHRDAVA